MPQIELPENCDLSKDQHKLILRRDLEQLARAIELQQSRVDAIETEPASSPLFPATFTPSFGKLANSPATTLGSALSWASTEGASLHGTITLTNAGTFTSWSGGSQTTYQRSGDTLSRWAAWCQANHSTSAQQLIADVYGALPAGLSGWRPSGVELDYRFGWSTVATDVCSVTTTVYVNGTAVASQTDQYTAVTTFYDTGWRTVQFRGDQLGAFRNTPGAVVQVRVVATNVRPGNCTSYLGNLIFNWE